MGFPHESNGKQMVLLMQIIVRTRQSLFLSAVKIKYPKSLVISDVHSLSLVEF